MRRSVRRPTGRRASTSSTIHDQPSSTPSPIASSGLAGLVGWQVWLMEGGCHRLGGDGIRHATQMDTQREAFELRTVRTLGPSGAGRFGINGSGGAWLIEGWALSQSCQGLASGWTMSPMTFHSRGT